MSEENRINVLLDLAEVDGYKIRAWGLVQLAALTPCIERIVNRMIERNVPFAELTALKEPDAVNGWITRNAKSLIFAIMPDVPQILSFTLKIPIDEVDNISPGSALKITMTIITQNMEHLKNWYGPAKAAAAEILDSAGQSNT